MMKRLYHCRKYDRYFGVWGISTVQQDVFMPKQFHPSHHSRLIGVFTLNCRYDHPLAQCLHTCLLHWSRCIIRLILNLAICDDHTYMSPPPNSTWCRQIKSSGPA